MQRPVSGMHIAHGLMHRRSLGFELGEGLDRKSCNDVIRSFSKQGFYGTKNERSKAGRLIWLVTWIRYRGRTRTAS